MHVDLLAQSVLFIAVATIFEEKHLQYHLQLWVFFEAKLAKGVDPGQTASHGRV